MPTSSQFASKQCSSRLEEGGIAYLAQWRSGAESIRLENYQPAFELTNYLRLLQKVFDDGQYLSNNGIVGNTQRDDSEVFLRRIPPDIGEIEIASKDGGTDLARMRGDAFISRVLQSDLGNMFRSVPEPNKHGYRRLRQIRIYQKTHGALRSRNRMKRFLLNQIARKLERGAHILDRQPVFALHIFKAHAASKAADDDCDGHTCAPNHGFPMSYGGIDDDAVGHRGSSLQSGIHQGSW